MPSSAGPHLRIVAAAALFSTGGAAIKACAFDSLAVAGLRSGIAALALLLLSAPARRGLLPWRWSTAVIGCAYAATLISFVTANKLTTAASTIFLQSTAPLYLLVLGPWLLKERVRRKDLLFMAAVGIGLAVFFVRTDVAGVSAPDPARGNLFALLSGFCYALTVTGLRWVAREDAAAGAETQRAAAVVLLGNAIGCAVCLPWAVPVSGTIQDWAVLTYLGVFQIALAYTLLTRALRSTSALEVSLLLLIEPVLNPIWAWLAQGEAPGGWVLAGGLIILVATALRTWSDVRYHAAP
ncbi:MAG TPA: EamA family transporter [Candidatus Polarisedimenticolia bacterium]|nr:EamA family transporter [Candidatus Polarisedimenticolia bacterium]